MTNVTGNWFDVVDGATGSHVIYDYSTTDIDYNVLAWGDAHDLSTANFNPYYQSSYGFYSERATPTIMDSNPFILGTIKHVNGEIPVGSGITSASLEITANFAAEGDLEPSQGTFVLSHDETLNNAEVTTKSCFLIFCSYSTSYDGDVPDYVELENTILSSSFQLGGFSYALELIGFGKHCEYNIPGGSKSGACVAEAGDSFSTDEQAYSRTDLLARLVQTPVVSVPEPGTLALFGMGLLAMAGLKRRKA